MKKKICFSVRHKLHALIKAYYKNLPYDYFNMNLSANEVQTIQFIFDQTQCDDS